MENSAIEWCDHTANFWSGCTKVSPACTHCYAETLSNRFPTLGKWGKGAPRTYHGKNARKNLLKWNKNVAALYERRTNSSPRPRVFINSLSDWLDDEVPIEWLADLLDCIHLCPNLDFLLLTKRPENWEPRIRSAMTTTAMDSDTWIIMKYWLEGNPPANVWIGTTAENQECADTRIPLLLNIPARIRFLSCEPLLGPLDLHSKIQNQQSSIINPLSGIHWIIAGGESGKDARPMHPDWARSLRDQAAAAKIPFLFKQWGEWLPICFEPPEWKPTPDGEDWHKGKKSTVLQRDGRIERAFPAGAMTCINVGKKSAGRMLDRMNHHAFPSSAAS